MRVLRPACYALLLIVWFLFRPQYMEYAAGIAEAADINYRINRILHDPDSALAARQQAKKDITHNDELILLRANTLYINRVDTIWLLPAWDLGIFIASMIMLKVVADSLIQQVAAFALCCLALFAAFISVYWTTSADIHALLYWSDIKPPLISADIGILLALSGLLVYEMFKFRPNHYINSKATVSTDPAGIADKLNRGDYGH